MNIWEKAGFLKSGETHPQAMKGVIIVRSKGSIIEDSFKYDDVSDNYQKTPGIIPIDHTLSDKTIYTCQYWKPFVLGAKLKLQDGSTASIVSIEPDIDAKKAFFNKKSVIGLTISLKGDSNV